MLVRILLRAGYPDKRLQVDHVAGFPFKGIILYRFCKLEKIFVGMPVYFGGIVEVELVLCRKVQTAVALIHDHTGNQTGLTKKIVLPQAL